MRIYLHANKSQRSVVCILQAADLSILRCYVHFTANSLPDSQCVNGAAANIFQKNAMGKFFKNVPAQIAGNCNGLSPARMTWNRIEATRLMVGHITATVPAWRIS